MCQSCITAELPDVQIPEGFTRVVVLKRNDEVSGHAGAMAILEQAKAERLARIGYVRPT